MSSSTSSKANGASISLKFIVVGGGIAGLAVAYTLRRAGHTVVVLEKKDANSMSFGMGGPIRAPPNMTKLLYRWGLGPTLNEKGYKSDRLVYVNGNCGDLLGSIILNEAFLVALLTDMVLIQHSDLFNILYDLAVREGVEIRQNAKVVHADPHSVSVRLDTGETISGDIIVAADGSTSSLRANMMGSPKRSNLESGKRELMVSFTVETSLLKDDESFKCVLDPTNWITWMAEGTIINTYILNGGKDLVGILWLDYNGPSKEGDEEWSNSRDLESYGLDITSLEPRMQKILKLSKTVSSRIFHTGSISEDFVNDRSSVVLIGEAAHPISEGTHDTALVIEDAETLGSLFSRIQCREQIKQLLTAYEEIRYARCKQMDQSNRPIQELMKCPVGPEQEARDALLHQTLAYGDWDHMDEATFQSVWGTQLSMLVYDANEAVDDWWVQWGSFIARGENLPSKSELTGLEVWISNE
ncbi:FAD/NAD(P)-binding domain-containing protein [Phlegmacium glaucopus]|nr:FAD/NAD(P)-binding domain-containing protein [Phlegmacium glaucopus]